MRLFSHFTAQMKFSHISVISLLCKIIDCEDFAKSIRASDKNQHHFGWIFSRNVMILRIIQIFKMESWVLRFWNNIINGEDKIRCRLEFLIRRFLMILSKWDWFCGNEELKEIPNNGEEVDERELVWRWSIEIYDAASVRMPKKKSE